MPRLEFTISPQVEFMPYLQTSSSEPPCAPTPGTSKKWLGTILRISSKARPPTWRGNVPASPIPRPQSARGASRHIHRETYVSSDRLPSSKGSCRASPFCTSGWRIHESASLRPPLLRVLLLHLIEDESGSSFQRLGHSQLVPKAMKINRDAQMSAKLFFRPPGNQDTGEAFHSGIFPPLAQLRMDHVEVLLLHIAHAAALPMRSFMRPPCGKSALSSDSSAASSPFVAQRRTIPLPRLTSLALPV